SPDGSPPPWPRRRSAAPGPPAASPMIVGPGTDPRPRDVLPARDGACGAGPGAQLLCRWAGLIVACPGLWHAHAPALARRPGAWGPDPAGTGPGRTACPRGQSVREVRTDRR